MKTLMLALIALGLFLNAGIMLYRPNPVRAAESYSCKGFAAPFLTKDGLANPNLRGAPAELKGTYNLDLKCGTPWGSAQ